MAGNLTSEYVYFAGRRIARRDAGGNVFYYVEDLLGSSREIVQAGQTAFGGVYPERSRRNADFYPGIYPERGRRGGERAVCIPDRFAGRVYTNTCVQHYKFMSHERDAESGLDDFGARYYSSQYGRFLSADWSAIPVAVPYANFTNLRSQESGGLHRSPDTGPQTLNLYAIVHDNPETFADLDGHVDADNSGAGSPGTPTNPANQAKKKCEEGGSGCQPAPPAEQPGTAQVTVTPDKNGLTPQVNSGEAIQATIQPNGGLSPGTAQISASLVGPGGKPVKASNSELHVDVSKGDVQAVTATVGGRPVPGASVVVQATVNPVSPHNDFGIVGHTNLQFTITDAAGHTFVGGAPVTVGAPSPVDIGHPLGVVDGKDTFDVP